VGLMGDLKWKIVYVDFEKENYYEVIAPGEYNTEQRIMIVKSKDKMLKIPTDHILSAELIF
jgi:hypothetical protein